MKKHSHMFDHDLFLRKLKETHPRLLFYPSCGNDLIPCVLSLPYDVFILSDSSPQTSGDCSDFWQKITSDARTHSFTLSLKHRTKISRIFQFGNKWGFLFFNDNNEVLEMITQSSFRVSAFVGIQDGCAEGGNYECVNEMPFLGKVLRASSQSMDYFTNHSKVLEDEDKMALCGHRYFRKSLLLPIQGTGSFSFNLKDILYCSSSPSCSSSFCNDVKSYATLSDGRYQQRFSTSDNCSPLWKLLPFRTQHNEGIIAYYVVLPGAGGIH